jgi:hypothetical protein
MLLIHYLCIVTIIIFHLIQEHNLATLVSMIYTGLFLTWYCCDFRCSHSRQAWGLNGRAADVMLIHTKYFSKLVNPIALFLASTRQLTTS